MLNNNNDLILFGEHSLYVVSLLFYGSDSLTRFKHHKLCFFIKPSAETQKLLSIVWSYCPKSHLYIPYFPALPLTFVLVQAFPSSGKLDIHIPGIERVCVCLQLLQSACDVLNLLVPPSFRPQVVSGYL